MMMTMVYLLLMMVMMMLISQSVSQSINHTFNQSVNQPTNQITRGVHPSDAMMHFPLVSEFPLFSENFSDSVVNILAFTFAENFFRFSSARFLMPFLVIDHKFPLISLFPQFPKNISFP